MPTRWPEAPTLYPADVEACRALLREGSHSFFAAARLLPPRVRDAATVLYAFCRLADDAVDGRDGDAQAPQRLRESLDRVYRGEPADDPVERALAAVCQRHGLPRALPEALLVGLEWDAAGARYDDASELYAYAARVAGSVGAMMAVLMGVRDRASVARACDLGVAMQLTNIARDVGEDARAGRLYLPRAWLCEAGIDPDAWLAAPSGGPLLAGVVRRQLNAADALYRRAAAGIPALPWLCRPGINAARLIYADIGRAIEHGDLDPVERRAVVGRGRKLSRLAAALVLPASAAAEADAPPVPECAYLVEAVAATAPSDAVTPAHELPVWGLRARLIWTIELFRALEARESLDRRGEQAPE
jgi:phytoene synthase